MLNKQERLFISSQFANNDYCRDELALKTKCNDSSFSFFTSRSNQDINNCGDYLTFAVRKNSEKIEEIFFSRQEACIVAVSATNILCRWIVEKKKDSITLGDLLLNIQKMISGEEYTLGDCQEISIFSNLKSFASRKSCLLLVVDSFFQIIAG